MMNRNNNNFNISNNCYMMVRNPYSMNKHHSASKKFGTWKRRPIDGRKWRNENENYGNVMTSGGDGTRFGKFRKSTQFRNRNLKKVSRFNNGSGFRFHPYVVARNARVMATPAEPDVIADDGDLSANSMLWGEVEKDWGLDVYGTMSGLIRLKSNVVDGVGSSSSGTGEDAEHVQFERRLSKYDIILPKSVCGTGEGGDLKSGDDGRTLWLEKENVMMKQSLAVMGRNMDDLKRRMEVVELQFRAKINKEVKDHLVWVNSEVEGNSDNGVSLG